MEDVANGVLKDILADYGIAGVILIGIGTYITTWLIERGENKAKINSLEKDVDKMEDWKEKLDRQMGALMSMPDDLKAFRDEYRADHRATNEKLDKLGDRISKVEGQLLPNKNTST